MDGEHGVGGFGSDAHVVVLVDVILLLASEPVPLIFPLQLIGPAVVFAFDFALVDAVPRSDRPGAAKVTFPGDPVQVVVLLLAKAFPLVATCAMPTVMTGTVLKAITAMNLRST